MEIFGKVIERYDISIIEYYFVEKINKEISYKNVQRRISKKGRALEKILEYVKELHAAGISSEEIAYFVRKLNSLENYWEVIE